MKNQGVLSSKKQAKNRPPQAKSFNCPKCGATLSIVALGKTVAVSCKSCQSLIDVSDPNYKILAEYHDKMKYTPYVPLGVKGTVGGKKFMCIGFMKRSDGPYQWSEYLLFNPYEGFRWLFEYEGHWTLYKKIKTIPKVHHHHAKYMQSNYDLFNKGTAKVDFVIGEFYWRVQAGDKASVTDYIHPPFSLSREKTEQELIWMHGRYIEGHQVQKAFRIKDAPPQPVGVAPNQPSPHLKQTKQLWGQFGIFLSIIFIAQMLRVFSAGNQNLLTYKIPKVEKEVTLISPSFYVDGKKSNLQIKANTNVGNSWVYHDVLLVHKETGKGIPAAVEASYYSGYSGGEHWSEGSKKATEMVYNVPAGEYYLSIKSQLGGRSWMNTTSTLSVKRDVVVWSNLWITLFLLALYPLLKLFRKRGFEVQRWSNSDFSPYHSED